MKIASIIEPKINRLPKGHVFTQRDFIEDVQRPEGLIKALNRMAETGKITKLSKGKYYKPEDTPFGSLKPSRIQLVKDLLERGDTITGYLTGLSVFNELGLTTQVSNLIQIGKKTARPRLRRAQYVISFVQQKNAITKENIPLLQLLDAIRFIKNIPDTTVAASSKRLLFIIKGLSEQDKSVMARLALKYPANTRAILGAMFEMQQNNLLAENLRKTLNPITTYKLKGIGEVLTNAKNWNIQ